jgi:hypothetical protein
MTSGAVSTCRRLGAAAAALVLLALPAGAADGGAAIPAPPRWSELRFVARKLLLTAETTVRVAEIAAGDAGLVDVPGLDGRAPAGPGVARVEVDSRALGRHTVTTALLDATDGAALQTVTRESGKRAREKVQRFAADTVAVTRARPAAGQEKLPVARWSRRSAERLPLPAAAPGEPPMTDSAGLFWLLATAPLVRPGDTLPVRLWSGGRVIATEVRVKARTQAALAIRERRNGAVRAVERTVPALELVIAAAGPGDGAEDEEVELLGLRGRVRVVLDAERRFPIELSGRVPKAGAVTVRLQEATLLD